MCWYVYHWVIPLHGDFTQKDLVVKCTVYYNIIYKYIYLYAFGHVYCVGRYCISSTTL